MRDIERNHRFSTAPVADMTCIWCADRMAWFNVFQYVHPVFEHAINVCRWCASSDPCRAYLKEQGYVRL